MSQMKRLRKLKSTKASKRKRLGLQARAQIRRNLEHVLSVTEKEEKIKYRIALGRGKYIIEEKDGTPYTHIKARRYLKINSTGELYNRREGVNDTFQGITALDPSTDVEPGNKPPIKRQGEH